MNGKGAEKGKTIKIAGRRKTTFIGLRNIGVKREASLIFDMVPIYLGFIVENLWGIKAIPSLVWRRIRV